MWKHQGNFLVFLLSFALIQGQVRIPGPGGKGAAGGTTPAHVQSFKGNCAFSSCSTVASDTPGASIGAGHSLEAHIYWQSATATITGVTDACGDTYTVVGSPAGTATGWSFQTAYVLSSTGGSCKTTVNLSATVNVISVFVHENSGTTAVDYAATQLSQTGFHASGAALTSPAITTTGSPSDYCMGSALDTSSFGGVLSPSAGWTIGSTTGTHSEASQYQVGSGSIAASFTDTTSFNGLVGVSCLKP